MSRILALDQLHHGRAATVRFLEPINLRDVGVIERGERLRFAGDACESIYAD